MISLKSKQKGFTIVELLIVIVVIGILAALVITTFTGIQKKARDTERTTDIKAMHGQVEAYYAQNGNYPTFIDMDSSTWRADNMKGLDAEALKDPKGATQNLASAPAANVYSYEVGPANCVDGTASGPGCATYTLTATLETSETPFTKSNLN